ncbi:MAG: hypothetical protein KF784_01660 [Fimbriimonadaceae bacterium]|nr:hypothetical protein [Fimbriimonadaceae bacterium]
MPEIRFDRYYNHAEIGELLKAYESEYPNLVTVTKIGSSYEGRDIWLVSVTAKDKGDHADKPAFWCDANIHASELSASTAVLHMLNKLCTQYGKDKQITLAVDTRTFYLVPRLCPDGAEWALETPPRIVRSSIRPYPFDEEDPYGLERQDMDGDGRILNMRIEDPNGAWKVCDQDERLLVRREPGDYEGKFYRVLPEGTFHNFDGLTMRARKTKEGLDMNRHFPSSWRPEHEQHGAGDYPAREPEIRAAVQAIVDRPNICGAICFHTFSGVHLRPPSRYADDELPAEDLWTYQALGDKGKEMTGYPAISNFHEFKYHPKEVITGVFDDWMYEHLGVYAWTTEIWSPQRQAGITDYKYIDWFREHPVEHDLMLLKWSDEKLDGKGHIDWYEFDHPQLGKVELGGWDALYAFRNPPLNFLENEVAPLGDWAIWQALCSPKLELHSTHVEAAGAGAWRIRVAVQNTGWLPTCVSKRAEEKKIVRGVVGEITLAGESRDPKGASSPDWLVSGELRQDKGQLVGRNHVTAGGFGWQVNGTDDMAVFEWVVASAGTYDVELKHQRAGTVRVSVQAS